MSATETTTRSEGRLHVKMAEAMYKAKIVSISLDEKNMLNIKMNKPKETNRFMGPSSRRSTKKSCPFVFHRFPYAGITLSWESITIRGLDLVIPIDLEDEIEWGPEAWVFTFQLIEKHFGDAIHASGDRIESETARKNAEIKARYDEKLKNGEIDKDQYFADGWMWQSDEDSGDDF